MSHTVVHRAGVAPVSAPCWRQPARPLCSSALQPARCGGRPSPLLQPHLLRSRAAAPPPPRAEAGGGAGSGSGAAGGTRGFSGGGGGGGSSGGGGGGMWAAYNELLARHPLLVKALTTAALSALGNLICQLGIEQRSTLDWRRFNTFTLLGLVWVAPCLHFWFATLNRLVTATGNAGALARMAVDQLCFAPAFIGSMLAILAALDGAAPGAALDAVRRGLPDAIRANWALWVPAQFLNFRYVPPAYQVLFANCVALVWNVYFSFATRPSAAAA